MLKAVKDIGQFVIKTEGLTNKDLLIEKSKLKRITIVIVVVLKLEENGKISFNKVYISDYDRSKVTKYLYRTFNHGRFDVTPTSKIPSVSKLKKRWDFWFGSFCDPYKSSNIINALAAFFKNEQETDNERSNNKKTMFDSIESKFKNLQEEDKQNSIITLKIEMEGSENYLGEIPIFEEIFRNESIKKFSMVNKVEAKGSGICNLCRVHGEMLGFASPFSVYTLDKRGFAPEFKKEDSWKRLPICKDCALCLIAGKEFLENYLSYSFYGYNYYVIPHFIFEKNEGREIIEELLEEIKSYENEDYFHGLLSEEEYISGIVKEKSNIFSLTFIFCKPKQKYFDIVGYVEGVSPSWMKKLHTTFEKVGGKSIFREEFLKKLFGINWSNDFRKGNWKNKRLVRTNLAGMLREFFPSSKKTGVYDKYFLDTIGAIIGRKRINEEFLIKAFLREIKNKYTSEETWSEAYLSLKSLYLLIFIKQLRLIEGELNMPQTTKSLDVNIEPNKEISKLEKFFNEFSEAFDMPEKRAAFLNGVVVALFMGIQAGKKGSTPFRKKLSGLRLDENRLRRLMSEVDEKFYVYDRSIAYLEIREFTTREMIKAENNGWKLNKDQISYYFTLGLNLGKNFKPEKSEQKSQEEN